MLSEIIAVEINKQEIPTGSPGMTSLLIPAVGAEATCQARQKRGKRGFEEACNCLACIFVFSYREWMVNKYMVLVFSYSSYLRLLCLATKIGTIFLASSMTVPYASRFPKK